MSRIIWLAFLLLMSFQVQAKCDFEYFSHNGYGYTCDYQYEAADLIQTLPDGNQSLCRNSVGGGEGNTSYIRTDIEHRDGFFMKQYFCFRKDLNEQFDRYYHGVKYRSSAADPPPGWAAGSRNNDSCQAGNNGSNPIHSALGRKFQQEMDMQVGEHLIFERRYSSASLATTPLGNGWSSNISMSLQEVRLEGAVGAAEMLAKRPNGDVLSFNIASDEPQSLSFGSKLVLKRSIDSSGAQVGWKLYVGGSRVEYYDLQGVWRSLMVDGVVVVTAERDAAGRIARLVDHTGRAIAVAYSDGRISSITDDAQHRVDYQYDSSGRLTAAVYGASSAAPTTRTYLY